MSGHDLHLHEKSTHPVANVVPTPKDTEQQADTTHEDVPSDPPDGGYGWVVVVAIMFLNAATWGLSARRTLWSGPH